MQNVLHAILALIAVVISMAIAAFAWNQEEREEEEKKRRRK